MKNKIILLILATIVLGTGLRSNSIILKNNEILNTKFSNSSQYIDTTKTAMVSSFTDTTNFETSDYELQLLELINTQRVQNGHSPLEYNVNLSIDCQNDYANILKTDTSKLKYNKNIVKKLSLYNSKSKLASKLSLVTKDTDQTINLLNQFALNDYLLNDSYSNIGLYIVEANDELCTTLYFS